MWNRTQSPPSPNTIKLLELEEEELEEMTKEQLKDKPKEERRANGKFEHKQLCALDEPEEEVEAYTKKHDETETRKQRKI